jgi:hypothetical protein
LTCGLTARNLAGVLAAAWLALAPADAAAQLPDAQRAPEGRIEEEPELPRPPRARRITLGDSLTHTHHNAMLVGTMSTALLGFLWYLPDDFPRFETPNPKLRKWVEAYTKPPVLDDGDWWAWNWIGHPFVGTHQYLLERNWGVSPKRAFLFSAASSLVWEYVFEASLERPSVPDMLLTAPVGAVIGEAVYQATVRMRRDGFSLPEKVVLVVINPFYVLQHGFR